MLAEALAPLLPTQLPASVPEKAMGDGLGPQAPGITRGPQWHCCLPACSLLAVVALRDKPEDGRPCRLSVTLPFS